MIASMQLGYRIDLHVVPGERKISWPFPPASRPFTEGAVFRRVRGNRGLGDRLSPRVVAGVVKAGAARLGLDPATFGAHSTRSGLVTSAVKRGVNLLKICDQTRHKSVEMLRVYCRDAELFQWQCGQWAAVSRRQVMDWN
jgi:hypothetical protein